MNGEVVDLKKDEIAELWCLYKMRDDADLDKELLDQFIKEKSSQNPLIQEILSDPSGQAQEYGFDDPPTPTQSPRLSTPPQLTLADLEVPSN